MKKICIVSKVPTHPVKAGNRARICSLITEYKKIGLEVHFLYIQDKEEANQKEMNDFLDGRLINIESVRFFPIQSYPIKILNRLKLLYDFTFNNWKNYLVDAWYPFRHHAELTKKIKEINPDYIQVEYIFLSYIFKYFPNVKKILDTHDTHANRHLKLGQNVWFSTSEFEEKKAVNRADVILAITEEEKKYFQQLCPDITTVTVGHIMDIPNIPTNRSHKTRIGFIGSANPVNFKTIATLLNDFKTLNKMEFELIVAGEICKEITVDTNQDNIILLGHSELNDFYQNIDWLYNPTFQSTGLKIKNVEALAFNKILITSHDGAKGLTRGLNKHFYCIDDFSSLIECVSYIRNNFYGDPREYIKNEIAEWRNNLKSIF